MGEYLLHLALVLAWVPLSLAIRFAGLNLGFAIARRYGDSSRGATAVAVGEVVNTGSFVLAAALPLLGLPTALVVGIMRLADSEQASGLGLLSGVAISLPLAVLFLFVGVFTFDQTPRDAAPRLAEAPASRTVSDVESAAEPGATPTRLAWVSRSQVHNIEGWVVYAAILIDDDQVDHLRAEARRMVDESSTSAARNLGFELTFDLLDLMKRSTATGLVAYARLPADPTPETTRRADLAVQRAVQEALSRQPVSSVSGLQVPGLPAHPSADGAPPDPLDELPAAVASRYHAVLAFDSRRDPALEARLRMIEV